MIRRSTPEAVLDAYEDALIRGLCHEGAVEIALRAVKGADRKILLRELEAAVKRAKTIPTIRIKRVYEPPSRTDGRRVLVDRLWPRGIAKDAAQLTEWCKDIAPSTALRQWFGHDPARWEEFQRRYHRELDAQNDSVDALMRLAEGGVLTLVYAAKDETHNQAVALRSYLIRRAKQTS